MLVLCTGLLSIILFIPFGVDNSIYQSMSVELLRYHKWPYLGSWDQNFPGILVFHIVAIALFGNSEIGFRVLDLLLQLGFICIFYKLLTRWLTPQTAWTAILLYIFWYVQGGGFVLGQRDVFGTMLTLATFELLQSDSTPVLRRCILSGLVTALAIAIRPSFGLFPVILFAFDRRLHSVKVLVAFTLSAFLPLIVLVLAYALKPGALEAAYLAVISYNLDLYSSFASPYSWLWQHFAVTVFPLTVLTIFGAVMLLRRHPVLGLTHRFNRSERTIYWGFLVGSIVILLVQRKFLAYHFATLTLLTVPVAALGWQTITKRLSDKIQLTTLIFLGILFFYPKSSFINATQALNHGENALDAFEAVHITPPINYYSEQQAYRYIMARFPSPSRVEAMVEPRLRADLGRNSATRFTTLWSLGLRKQWDVPLTDSVYTPYQLIWRKEFIDSLESVKPVAIVITRIGDAWKIHDFYDDILRRIPRFDSVLQNEYVLDTIFGAYEIYRLRK